MPARSWRAVVVGCLFLGVFVVCAVSVSVVWVAASGAVLGSASFSFVSRSACARWLRRLRAARRWWLVGWRRFSSAAEPCARFGVPVPSLRWLWFRFFAAGGFVVLSVAGRRFVVPRGPRLPGCLPGGVGVLSAPVLRWLCSRSSALRSLPLPLWFSCRLPSGLRVELPAGLPGSALAGC